MKAITEMTDYEIMYACATEVMGWKLGSDMMIYYDEDGQPRDMKGLWKPLKRFGQCGEMLDKLEGKFDYQIRKMLYTDNKAIRHYCGFIPIGIPFLQQPDLYNFNSTKERAICLACIKAVRWLKEKGNEV